MTNTTLIFGTQRGAGGITESKLPMQVAALRHRCTALVDPVHDTRLVVLVRREDLRLLRRNCRVPRNQRCHDSASRLNPKRQRRNVKQEDVVRLLVRTTSKDARLDSSAVRNSLVWVDRLVRLLPVEEVLQKLDDLRNPRRPANKDNLVDRPMSRFAP